MIPWNSTKAKVDPVQTIVYPSSTHFFISVQRLRTLQEKKGAQAKASRRDIATLIERGKLETARVKVETIINEDIHIELLELLELYCELLIARFGLLDINHSSSREPDPAISEGVCSIIFSAPRTEVKELHVLRDILMHKYGREFSIAVMENRDGRVSDRVVRKLDINMPSPELVNAYLAEIAKAYGVSWTSPNTPSSDDNIDDGSNGDEKQTAAGEANSPPAYRPESAAEPGPTLPAIPPSNIDGPGNKKSKPEDSTTPVSKAPPAVTDTVEDEFEALNRRFAALKKK
ncbi:DUF292-domain-containing protein [Desarmillaria tabescens]|uniref:DUF292-domain-containing protein n=1 Tax=Armillaria tabescens TaxID=1929756 RepID=A0AA39TXV2_ARMTA|nr:DUF292-domain-containing protein [Desarmillaria tabescens]KAK0466319.1 DUF292-domain-containing protein [Desarmillaria tabescens]